MHIWESSQSFGVILLMYGIERSHYLISTTKFNGTPLRSMQTKLNLVGIFSIRLLSTKAQGDSNNVRQWLQNLKPDKSLLRHFKVTYTHSSGKGGQHVNKTDTKAQMSMSSSSWYRSRGSWMNENAFDEIMKNYINKDTPVKKRFPYFTISGDILVESQLTRYRDKNLQDCLDKFVHAVRQCGEPRQRQSETTKRTWARYRKVENEKRLHTKKHRQENKQFRKKISLGDL